MKKSIRASSKLSWLWSFGLAVLLVGLATVLSLLLVELADHVIFILYYAAVAAATWRGGLRAGLLAIALSALASAYFLLPPPFSFEVGLQALIQVFAFVLVALFIVSLIGGRMQAEASVAEREKQLRLIIDAAPVLISYVGADLCYRFNNRTYESWFGLPQTEIPGRHVRDVVGEPAYQALLPHYKAVLAGQQVNYEQLIPYQSGERYVQAAYTPDFDEQGQVRGFVVLVNDISQRRQAEESLQLARAEAEQVRAWLERILAGIKDDFVMYDHDWRYIYVNDRAAQTLGFPKEKLVGQRIWDLFPDAVDNLFYQKMHQAMAEGREVAFEHYYAPFDKWFENRAYPISDGLLLFTTDITERKRAEVALRESEARFRRMADSVPVMISLAGPDKQCTYFNQSWLEFTGRSIEQELGFGWAENVHPDDYERCLEIFHVAFDARQPFEMEYRLRRHDGEYRWIVDRATPLFESDYFAGYISSCIDIHERKRAELAERLLAETGKVLVSSLDPAIQLSNIASLAVPDLADWCAVDLYEEDWTVHHVAVAHVDPAKVTLAHEVQQRYPPRLEELKNESQPWQRGESQLYPEITEAMLEAGAQDAEHYQILRELRLNSAMIVPLVVRNRVLGLIAFFWAESGHHYDEQDLTLAEELARRAAVAIDNTRAYEAERRARAEAETAGERLHLLSEASEILIASTSYEIALSTLARLLVPRLADWCAVDLIGQDGLIHRLVVVHRDPAKAEAADQLQRRYPIIDPHREHTITKMLRRRQSWLDPAVSETRLAAEARDAEHLQLLRELGFASEMVVLLTARGRTLGALTLVRTSRERCYGAGDLALAEELARRATIVVDNARLYEAEQQAREAAEQATQRIASLQAVTARLATALTPADVVQVVLEEGLPALGSNAGSVVRLDGEEIEIVGITGFPEKVTRPWQRFPLSANTPIAEVARTGRSIWLESPEAFQRRYDRLPDPAALAVSQSWGALPLVAYGQLLGALALSYPEPQAFDPDSRRFAETLADLCAQALERARLYQEMQQLNVELEERVAQRTAELERSLKELDQFSYIASHDLKAPLRGVKQLSTWIVEDAGDILPEASKVHLNKMQSRIHRMEKLLDDLLMYSRVGRSYYGSVEDIDTGALVKEIIELLAPPPTFTVTVQAGMPSLTGSRMLLELVFKNLIENAIKYHHRVDGRVEVSASELDDMVEFSVTDDGPGIDERFHERIFQIFQTLQPRDKIESTGVGLAIVKKTVESQGGTIRIISAEGQGTTFRFTWPKN